MHINCLIYEKNIPFIQIKQVMNRAILYALIFGSTFFLVLACNSESAKEYDAMENPDNKSINTLTKDQLDWVKTTSAYQQLESQISTNEPFKTSLTQSLNAAKLKASNELAPDLYQAIDRVFGGDGQGWPTNPDEYLAYVSKFLVLIPNEIIDEKYPTAWTSDQSQNGYNQKVYDLLCQFYFLVDQPVLEDNKTMQSFKSGSFLFAEWLRAFAIDWGAFLDTPASLTPETLASFQANSMYNFELYSEQSSEWKTFNNFFYRQFNGADEKGHSPLRPIAEPNNNQVITAPADCTFKEMFHIDSKGEVIGVHGQADELRLKRTHSVNSVAQLLDDEELAKAFYGGTFVHYFLSPFDYHRFHTPVSGKVLESKVVYDKVFLDVEFNGDGEFHAPDNASDGYEFQQTRGVFVVDAGDPVGLIAVIPVGMAQVSGVDMYTSLKGQQVAKGDEFGKFRFGGSDNILVFQKNPNLFLWKKDPVHNPIHFQFGQVCAYWNGSE